MSYADMVDSGSGKWGKKPSSSSSQGYPMSSENAYTKLSKAIETNLRTMNYNVSKINDNSNMVGTHKDSQEIRKEILDLINQTRMLGTKTAQLIKDFSSSDVEEPNGNYSEKKKKQMRLKEDFEGALTRFKDTSTNAMKRINSKPAPKGKSGGGGGRGGGKGSRPGPSGRRDFGAFDAGSARPYNSDDDDDEDDIEKQKLLKKQSLMEIENDAEFQDALIQDREEGIIEIEKMVKEINEIFIDLAELVQEQDPMIHHIDENISASVVAVQKGVGELKQAQEYQRSGRNKMCYLLIAIIVLIAAAVVIVGIGLGVFKDKL